MKRSVIAALIAAACAGKLRPVQAGIAVDPDHLDFGNAAVGATQELRGQVSNTSIVNLEVQGVRVAGDAQGELAVADVLTTDCAGNPRSGTTLLPGECASFLVRWTPKAPHAAQGAIEIDSDDAQNPVITLPVAGNAIEPALQVCVLAADGSVDPSACTSRATSLQNVPTANFGSAVQGQTLSRTVRMTNGGNAPLQLSPAPRLASGTSSDFSLGVAPPPTLAPGASANLAVSVTPSGNGSVQGALEILSDDPLAADVKIPLLLTVSGWKLCVVPDSGLAFGNVSVGQRQTLNIAFSNCGNVDFDLTAFAFTPVAPTTTQLSVAAGQMPAVPRTLKVGDQISLDVTYAPTLAQADAASFDVQLALPGGQVMRDSWPVTGTGVAVGGCGTPPVAKITVYRNGGTVPINPLVARLAPLDTLALDGSASSVPNGGPQYTWQVISEPPGANDPLTGSGVRVSIQVRQAGDYTLGLTVKDAQSCTSGMVPVTLHVVPLGAVHVELTWKENYGDVDLHYIGPGGSFYEDYPDQGDLDWEYSQASAVGSNVTRTPGPSPDWGYNNTVASDGITSDDASLDVDQQWGYGPENVTHLQPFDGTYTVLVHYYCASAGEDPSNPKQGPATATVRVWVNGVLWPATPPTAVLQAYQVWTAATVTVSNGGQTVTVAYSSSSPHNDNTGAQNCGNSG